MKIGNKTVLVTGASSGIGAATAKLAAQHGAKVILLARDQQRLQLITDAVIDTGGSAESYSVDLVDLDAIVGVANQIQQTHGTPDVIINNAGAGRWLSIMETELKDMVNMMAVPYFAAFALTRCFLPAMLARDSGHIVNVTSVASRMIFPGAAAYTAARWAMIALNESLRAELAATRIGVTLAMFGKVSSEYWQHNPGSEQRVPGIARMAPTLSVEQAANAIIRSVERNQRRVIKPHMMRFFLALNTLMPQGTELVLRNTGWNPGKSKSAMERFQKV